MRRKAGAWVLFLLCLLLLSLSATPYSRAANSLWISVRLALIAVISILVVRERWRYRHDLQGANTRAASGSDTRFLRQLRSWFYDDKAPPR